MQIFVNSVEESRHNGDGKCRENEYCIIKKSLIYGVQLVLGLITGMIGLTHNLNMRNNKKYIQNLDLERISRKDQDDIYTGLYCTFS
jgi:hypothetical protein